MLVLSQPKTMLLIRILRRHLYHSQAVHVGDEREGIAQLKRQIPRSKHRNRIAHTKLLSNHILLSFIQYLAAISGPRELFVSVILTKRLKKRSEATHVIRVQ